MTKRSGQCDGGVEFEEVYHALREHVAAVAWQMTGSEALVDEAVQETFLLVYRHLPQFRGESDVGTWVYRIALRVAVRLRERERARVRTLRSYQNSAPAPADSHAAHISAEQRDRLVAALNRLSDEHRTVLTLLSLRDLTAKQVGEVLGIPEGTVWSRAAHARRRMREVLRKDDARDQSATSSDVHSTTSI